MDRQDRLAELLGALSLASDRARGQAPESALGTTVIATRLARHLGLSVEEQSEVYFTALTRVLGCTSTAPDVSSMALGDDLSFTYSMHMCDQSDIRSVRDGLDRHFAPDADPEERQRTIDTVVDLQPEFPYLSAPISQQAVALTRRLPVPANIPLLLEHVDARWDGKNPTKPGGAEIPLAMRIVEFATVVELYRRAGGVRAAQDVAVDRSGGQFDPAVCEAFRRHGPDLLDGFDQATLWDVFLAAEPGSVTVLEEEHRTVVAEVSADFTDNKSGWFVGHSRRVARLAFDVAQHLGWSDADCDAVRLAGLLHDLGRCAVPNGIWDKPDRLTQPEERLARTHSNHTEEILGACIPLRPMARLAGSAHERADGSGYHHGSTERGERAALLAVADVYIALVSDRPWRDAHDESAAIEILDREAGQGRLSPSAVHAVFDVRGHRSASSPELYPDGLTRREVEVLELLARGLLTKQIAARLGIAYKTVDNHVQNLYRKIGANSRTAAAMYAVERGIYAD